MVRLVSYIQWHAAKRSENQHKKAKVKTNYGLLRSITGSCQVQQTKCGVLQSFEREVRGYTHQPDLPTCDVILFNQQKKAVLEDDKLIGKIDQQLDRFALLLLLYLPLRTIVNAGDDGGNVVQRITFLRSFVKVKERDEHGSMSWSFRDRPSLLHLPRDASDELLQVQLRQIESTRDNNQNLRVKELVGLELTTRNFHVNWSDTIVLLYAIQIRTGGQQEVIEI